MPGIKDFNQKVVVVTGAGSGIGRAIAHGFADLGACLVITDIDGARIQTVEMEIAVKGVPVISRAGDVSNLSDVQQFADVAMERFGRVDVLVNNAGIGWGGPVDYFPIEDFHRVMDVNFWGVINGVQSFLPILKKQGCGHIVNMSSSAGLNGIAALSAYSASKHAVAGYTEVLRAEMRRYNIGVSAICPGVINTNVVRDGKSTQTENMRFTHQRMIDFYQKWGWPPERVAKAVVKAVQKNKGVVPVGPEAWVLWFLKRFSQLVWDLYMRVSVKLAF